MSWRICLAAVALALLVAPPSAWATNAIQNGEFSEGLAHWPVTVVNESFGSYPHIEADDGEFNCGSGPAAGSYVKMDVPGSADGYIEQAVKVPADGELRFAGWGAYEAVEVTISAVVAGTPHTLLSYSPATLEGPGAGECSGSAPETQVVDMSEYAGQEVGLRVEATSGGVNGTIVGLTDFELEAGGPVASVSGEPSVALPESGTAQEAFTISLSEASSEPIEVSYKTEDGTAKVEDDDYTEASGTVTFAPGETSKTVEVTVDDGGGNDEEPQEHYKMAISAATNGATVSSTEATATGTIGLPGFSGHTFDGHGHPLAGAKVTISGRLKNGGAITRELTTGAGGEYSFAADPGEYSIYAHGVPAGQPTGLKWTPSNACPGKVAGAYCEKIQLSAADGKSVSAKVDFAYGIEDPQAENLEVMQAVQKTTFDAAGPQLTLPNGSKASSFSYSGVEMVAGGKTIVRLYGSDNGALTAEAVPAQLRAYSGSGSSMTELPGGPVAPIANNLNLLPAPRFEEERGKASETYVFVLPEAWTKTGGPITLLGTVDPEQKWPECKECRENDNVALTGVKFTEVPALQFVPMSLGWKEKGTFVKPSDPVEVVTRTWPFWPLPENGLKSVGAPISIDISEDLQAVAKQLKALPAYAGHPLGYNTASLPGCLSWTLAGKLDWDCVNLIEPRIFAQEKGLLPASAGKTIAVAAYDDTALEYGVMGAANEIGGQVAYVPASRARSEVVVHEMLHELGFNHSGCTKPGDEEAWPSNPKGQASLLGYGINRSYLSPETLSMYETKGVGEGHGWHDIMSYCWPDWMSSLNWERTLQRLAKGAAPKGFASYPGYSMRGGSAHAAAHGPVLTVESVNLGAGQTIAEVQPGAHVESSKRSGYTFVALGTHGRVIAHAPAMTVETHGDETPGSAAGYEDITMLQAELPASAIGGLELMRGKQVVSHVRAPLGRLTLKVSAISHKACLRHGALVLHFRAKPRGELFGRTRVFAQVGKRRVAIAGGAERGSVVLSAGAIPKGSRRLIVEFSDGFASMSRAVKFPKGCRAG